MTSAKRKSVKTSTLEEIPGIGNIKAKKLLAHFKSLAKIKAADMAALCEVSGITASDAESIIGYFNSSNSAKG